MGLEKVVQFVYAVVGRFFEIHRFTNSFRPTFILATLEQTWLGLGLRPDPRWGSTRKNLVLGKTKDKPSQLQIF